MAPERGASPRIRLIVNQYLYIMEQQPFQDIVKYKNQLSWKNKAARLAWSTTYYLLFRPFATTVFNPWRLFLLRLFGARLHPHAHVHASAKIWAPWNLAMEKYSCLGPHVNCYNVDHIRIGANATLSQEAYLCTASHDITDKHNRLITAPIIIEDRAWIAAQAFIGMGVTIGQGAVVGARAAIFKNVEAWSIMGGNPAKFIKKRVIK